MQIIIAAIALLLVITLISGECLNFADQFSLFRTSPNYLKCLSAIQKTANKIGFSNPEIVEVAIKTLIEDHPDDYVKDHKMFLREAWYGDVKNLEFGLVSAGLRQALNMHVRCDQPKKLILGIGHDAKMARVVCDL